MSSDAWLAYVPFYNGTLAAYDLQTGARRWLRSPPSGYFHGSPVISRDTLFLGGYDGAYAIRK